FELTVLAENPVIADIELPGDNICLRRCELFDCPRIRSAHQRALTGLLAREQQQRSLARVAKHELVRFAELELAPCLGSISAMRRCYQLSQIPRHSSLPCAGDIICPIAL